MRVADSDIGVLREYLPKVDQACRETWLADGNEITPDFLRRILVPHIFEVTASRYGSIKHNLEQLGSKNWTELRPALSHLAMEIVHLKNEISGRCEIEAIEIAKRASRAASEVADGTQAQDRSVGNGQSGQSIGSRKGTTAIARNIDKLRKECGWSFDQLAAATGIDRRLVVYHIQGKHRPVPRLQREYAQAFAKRLDRPIIVNNLEE